jgi:adenosylcobinamide-GDP ribazoletransferase
MRHFIAAIQFITIIPVGRADTFDPPKMIPFFPIVGLCLGLLMALFDHFATTLWSRPVVSLLDILLLAVLTGAFHLDGLGDSADGLLGQRTKDKALTIMKDSRLGTMGLVAIVFGLALKWAGIAGLDTHRTLLLIIVPAYARAGMLFGMRFLEYGRPDGGTGTDFFKTRLEWPAFWGLTAPVVLSVFLGWTALGLNLGFIALTAVLIWYYKRRLGCVTGDMLGATAEILESGLFFLVSMGGVG